MMLVIACFEDILMTNCSLNHYPNICIPPINTRTLGYPPSTKNYPVHKR